MSIYLRSYSGVDGPLFVVGEPRSCHARRPPSLLKLTNESAANTNEGEGGKMARDVRVGARSVARRRLLWLPYH